MTRPIDYLARKEALNTSESFIIQAPAGSGKTELLTQRVLALLGKVDEPEEILAITFTRKAASEMRERIIKALLLAANHVEMPEAEHERTTRELALTALEKYHLNQ